ncbi:MAG: DegT/DnrJ/EryC1/StrS family aminotransferase [Myxococcota bacterium]
MADLAARHARVAEAVERGVLEVLRSGRYVGGPVVAEAEHRLAAMFGWRHGVGVNSGTDALVYALQALGVSPGDEVIVPAVTFFATAGAVARIGARPVVADVRADLPLLDPATLPIGPRTRAVVAVHLFGEACVLPDLPVPVVDDAAQAAGADPPAKVGAVGAASFYPTKTLGAAGDGGIVLADDPELAARARKLANHGMPEPHLHETVKGHVGANSRLDAVQAAVLLAHLDDLAARVARRRAIAARYDEAIAPRVRPLPRGPGHPVHHYVVLAGDRDALKARLADRGIETALYYPRPLSAQPAIAPQPPTPRAARFCAEALALPVHEDLGDDDVARVIEAVLDA